MSDERDELAVYISDALDEVAASPVGEPTETDFIVADALIKVGYRKPRTVTAVEELDALGDGALIRTRHGAHREAAKLTDGTNIWRSMGPARVLRSEELTLWDIPATVLHEGDDK